MTTTAHGIKDLPGNRQAIQLLGLNATLIRDREVVSVHFPGPNHLRDLADHCDNGEWLVRTISTPASIYRDLQGTREVLKAMTQRNFGKDEGRSITGHTSVEAFMLAKIGRRDLLEANA